MSPASTLCFHFLLNILRPPSFGLFGMQLQKIYLQYEAESVEYEVQGTISRVKAILV